LLLLLLLLLLLCLPPWLLLLQLLLLCLVLLLPLARLARLSQRRLSRRLLPRLRLTLCRLLPASCPLQGRPLGARRLPPGQQQVLQPGRLRPWILPVLGAPPRGTLQRLLQLRLQVQPAGLLALHLPPCVWLPASCRLQHA
jgi:hypothetical protein